MIDPHVHLRDWKQKQKETVAHGLFVAEQIGLDAVFEMPNTDPALADHSTIEQRISLADAAKIDIFHGLYAGITNDSDQILKIVNCYEDLFPRVIGIKMFAGHSTGNMGIISYNEQEQIYETLTNAGFKGVLAVHCEKEFLLTPERWDPTQPSSHDLARPPEAETESIKDQIKLVKKTRFKGTLHICHVSSPESIDLIIEEKGKKAVKITCGATPHHCVLHKSVMNNNNGLLMKVNPPVRSIDFQEKMLNHLLAGHVDWIETDHAPHLTQEKTSPPYPSGIVGLPFYPFFIELLRKKNISPELLYKITHSNIEKAFNITIPSKNKLKLVNLSSEYDNNVFSFET